MLTKAGAKLLDFGLAKLKPPEQAGGLSALPTQPADLTQQGAILGTFQYMAPEQLEGQEADARTDIFAFGTLVYEMVTGRKAFEGKSQASLISAIMTADPPVMSELQAMSPPALDRIVRKCLEKDPEVRWHSTHDLRDALRWSIEAGTAVAAQSTTQTAPTVGRSTAFVLAGGALVVGSMITGLVVWRSVNPADDGAGVRRFTIEDPRIAVGQDLAISPDGTQVVYHGQSPDGDGTQLFIRRLDQFDAEPLPTGLIAGTPSFSPNGDWVGFRDSAGTLGKISIFGGGPQRVTNMGANLRGMSWGADDQLFIGSFRSGLRSVPVNGGPNTQLTTLDASRGETTHRWPSPVVGQRAVLFVIGTSAPPTVGELATVHLDTGSITRLGLVGTYPQYAASGHLVYLTEDGSLRAAPFDPDRLEVTGDPVTVVEGVVVSVDGAAGVDISETGDLVYMSGTNLNQRSLVWVDREGMVTTTVLNTAQNEFGYPRLSPDGRKVAIMRDFDV